MYVISTMKLAKCSREIGVDSVTYIVPECSHNPEWGVLEGSTSDAAPPDVVRLRRSTSGETTKTRCHHSSISFDAMDK
jgi:hypothetical protein